MEPTKRCPYCAEEVLSAAIQCKHCGSNLVSGSPRFAQDRMPSVVRTQQTIKPITVVRVIGWILLSWGFVLYFGNSTGPDTADRYGGAVVGLIGLIMVIYARVARWRKHE